jgi:hypothetical protein
VVDEQQKRILEKLKELLDLVCLYQIEHGTDSIRFIGSNHIRFAELPKPDIPIEQEYDGRALVIKPEYNLIVSLHAPYPKGYNYSLKAVADLFGVNVLCIEGILEQHGAYLPPSTSIYARKPMTPDLPTPLGQRPWTPSYQYHQTHEQILTSVRDCQRIRDLSKDLEVFLLRP